MAVAVATADLSYGFLVVASTGEPDAYYCIDRPAAKSASIPYPPPHPPTHPPTVPEADECEYGLLRMPLAVYYRAIRAGTLWQYIGRNGKQRTPLIT